MPGVFLQLLLFTKMKTVQVEVLFAHLQLCDIPDIQNCKDTSIGISFYLPVAAIAILPVIHNGFGMI